MTADKLKKRIKEKFGTITAFAEAAGIERYELQKAFMAFYSTKPKYRELLLVATDKLTRLRSAGSEQAIPAEKIEALREAIEAYGGAAKLCAEEFGLASKPTVYGILAGKLNGGPVKATPTVVKVFKRFEIDI